MTAEHVWQASILLHILITMFILISQQAVKIPSFEDPFE